MIKVFNNLIKNNYIKNYFFKKYNIINFQDFENSIFKDIIIKKFCFKNSSYSCYMEITPIIGGIDAFNLSTILYDFYCKWIFKKNINIEIYNEYENKKVAFIKNKFSFSLFRRENGVHRIIRKNPLLTSNKVQTSFLVLNIIPKKKNNFFIDENDIIVECYKSKGSGGQHINTTDSAVRIIHKPTNTIITCQSERSQIQNKISAIKIMEYKLYLKKNIDTDYYLSNFKNYKKYIRTYNYVNNEVIDHTSNIKYNLNNFFNNFLNFLII